MIAMNSLMKLSIYSDSDSEEETEERHQNRLPLPEFLNKSSTKKPSSQQVSLDGKVRNFPHEPGNWATYIYLPLDSPSRLINYLEALSCHFKALNLKAVDDFHISLTRTVTLRHHWIVDFTKSVHKNLAQVNPFEIHLFGLKAYTNEQKTRSFLSLTVAEGEDDLKMVASQLDNCLREYNLQCFYDNPSFHTVKKSVISLPQSPVDCMKSAMKAFHQSKSIHLLEPSLFFHNRWPTLAFIINYSANLNRHKAFL